MIEFLTYNRSRFAKELISAVRDFVAEAFPICLRYSQWTMTDYEGRLGQSPEELKVILDILSAAGVDIFHCSRRRFWLPEF